MGDDDLLEALEALHTAEIDARSGYEEARNDAREGDDRPVFQEMIALHTKNADDLSHVLQRSGRPPDWNGSVMAAVHRAAMGVRSLLGGLGEGIEPTLAHEEERHAARYGDLLGRPDVPGDVREVLQTNRGRLEEAIARLRP